MTSLNKTSIAIVIFFIATFVTFFAALNFAVKHEIEWTNTQLSELKKERDTKYLDLNDETVKKILALGNEEGLRKYQIYKKWGYALVILYFLILFGYIYKLKVNRQ